jgi:hypothetical protein
MTRVNPPPPIRGAWGSHRALTESAGLLTDAEPDAHQPYRRMRCRTQITPVCGGKAAMLAVGVAARNGGYFASGDSDVVTIRDEMPAPPLPPLGFGQSARRAADPPIPPRCLYDGHCHLFSEVEGMARTRWPPGLLSLASVMGPGCCHEEGTTLGHE